MNGRSAFLLLLVVSAVASGFPSAWFDRAEGEGEIHALIVAPAPCDEEHCDMNLADMAQQSRLYHQLIERGVKAENIVVILNEDVVYSEKYNPWPGKLYDNPDQSHEWFEGVKVDYSGKDITPKNYLAVLTGHKEELKLAEGSNSTGRVLETGLDSRIFVYHGGHGAQGLVELAEDFLYAKDLHEAFERMEKEQKFKELFYVIDTCLSGSMLANALSDNGTIYAITSANVTEDAKFNDCKAVDSGHGMKEICFNDVFGHVFFNNTQSGNAGTETLKVQYEFIRDHIISDFPPKDQSHAQEYGSRRVAEEKAVEFEGEQQPAANRQLRSVVDSPIVAGNGRVKGKIGAYYQVLEELKQAENSENSEKTRELQRKLEEFEKERSAVRSKAAALVRLLIDEPTEQTAVLSAQPASIDDFGCHRDVLKKMAAACPQISKGTFTHDFIAVLTELVNRRVECGRLVDAVGQVCN
ncbi:Legumain [Aphelenchoides fujianensis]|nr:Legumain [Aphelenchoides fujianensis]